MEESWSVGGKTGRRKSQVKSDRGSECMGGSGDMKEGGQVGRGKVVKGLKGKEEDLEVIMEFNEEPVMLYEDGYNVVDKGGFG